MNIVDYENAVVTRIGQLTLPVEVEVVSEPAPVITAETVANVTKVTVNGGQQEFERTARGGARHLPAVVVGIHRKLGTVNGRPDRDAFNLHVILAEEQSKQLLQAFPSSPGTRVESVEMAQLYNRDLLRESGMFQCGILLRFAGENFET